MADLSQINWSEIDANNNQAAPLGAPERMFPSGVNDTMRQMMGATKRFWDRINGSVKATNVGNDYTYSGAVSAPALVDGEMYCFRVGAANTGAARLNVGVGGFQPIVKPSSGGAVTLSSSEMLTGSFVQVIWDSLSAHFVMVNLPGVETQINDVAINLNVASVAFAAAVISLDDRITSQSALVAAYGTSLANLVEIDLHSASIVIKADITSVSSVIKADITSVSSVIKTDIASVSLVIETRIQSLSATVSTILNTAVAGMTKRQRLPLAWGSFTGNTPSLSLFFGFNFLSVSRSAGQAGKYRVKFQQALDSTNGLAVIGNGNLKVIYVTDAGASPTTSSIKLEAYNPGEQSDSDDVYVSFVVYGNGYS